ncbi:MAG: hypothetical protein WBP41_01790, partial [Saprospiraceae bacterium]
MAYTRRSLADTRTSVNRRPTFGELLLAALAINHMILPPSPDHHITRSPDNFYQPGTRKTPNFPG